MALVMPTNPQARQRRERSKALFEWDAKLHETLALLREALEQIKIIDKKGKPDAGSGS